MYKVKIYTNNFNTDNISNWRANMQYTGNIDGFEIKYYIANTFDPNDDLEQDIIIIIRPVLNFLNYIEFLKSNGVKVIVDYDDPFPLIEDREFTHIQEVISILKVADFITTTNENMKLYLYHHSYSENICVLPNIINENLIPMNKKFHYDKVVLGWYGSSGKHQALLGIRDTILKILDEYENVVFYIFTSNVAELVSFNHPKVVFFNYIFDFQSFQNHLEDIDINLAPIVENYFNLHKSNIGIILPGWKGIPTVSTCFAEYKKLGSENTLLCNDIEDWYDNIKILINDIEKRYTIGTNIQNYVKNNLTFDIWRNKKSELFYQILNKK